METLQLAEEINALPERTRAAIEQLVMLLKKKAVEPARCNILQLFLAQVTQPAYHAPKHPAQATGTRTCCCAARCAHCCTRSVAA